MDMKIFLSKAILSIKEYSLNSMSIILNFAVKENNDEQFIYFCILDIGIWVKVHIKDLDCGQLGQIKKYTEGCFICKGKTEDSQPVILTVSHDGVYCGIDHNDGTYVSKALLSSNKKFKITIEKIISIREMFNEGRLRIKGNLFPVTVIYVYDNKDLRLASGEGVCIDCGGDLISIGQNSSKWVCNNSNCKVIYAWDEGRNEFKKRRSRMSGGSFARLIKANKNKTI